MTKQDLLTLADDLEAATEGSRELDARIECLLNYHGSHLRAEMYWPPESAVVWVSVYEGDRLINQHAPINYTRSLDAAYGLIPAGFSFSVHSKTAEKPLSYASVNNVPKIPFAMEDASYNAASGNTDILAICAASIRAIASNKE